VSGPRLAVRGVRDRRHVVDLLFYDDVLAVVPTPSWAPGDPLGMPVLAVLAAVLAGRLRRRRQEREASPRTLPRRTSFVPLADIRSVRVEPRPYGAARLHVDGRRYDVPETTRYRPPWREGLERLLGDRLTIG
jgi:hypothetical protein